ncbi:MAG: TldD/PmbA family protein [Oscillospiraceae bacterium]|nr:TldD/PmbA family protein [Oscillospiraceae bacterium]
MLDKKTMSELIAIVLHGGADFAEVYAEYTKDNRISYADRKIETVANKIISGVGIRGFLGTRTFFASTTDLTPSGLRQCALRVAQAVGHPVDRIADFSLVERVNTNIHPIRTNPFDVSAKVRCDLVRTAADASWNAGEQIIQVSGMLLTNDKSFVVANSEGLYTSDRQIRTRMMVNAIASDGSQNQQGMASPGRQMGLEVFEMPQFTPEKIGAEAARQALVNLKAIPCPSGQMTVAIASGFGGVIFHEACGHSLEAACVGIGMSQMCGKLGQQVAGTKVTAIDDGTIANGWGSCNIDDEGNPNQRRVLIENGILKSYMVDRLGSRRMGVPHTASARRQNYSFETTSRMTNTFIANGPDTNEEIIASIEDGIYCASMGGGSVNPFTGDFNFAAREAYLVKNGKICEPVRGAALIGNGGDVIQKIDMVGQDLDTAQGNCGASSGMVPTDVGQPMIRVSSITVGGQA